MPEGPEVKTIARTLNEAIVGHTLLAPWHSGFRLRNAPNMPALRKLEGTKIDLVACYGKIIFIESQKKTIIVAQLGMTGQLVSKKICEPLLPHTHIRWPLKNSSLEIRYVDPRRFGLFDACDEQKRASLLKKLGPDPFYLKKNQYASLIAKMKSSTRAIKNVLLDQNVVVGVGNIYASEVLFLSKIHPGRKASDISNLEYKKLIEAIILVLNSAYKNCGTTFSNYVDGLGNKGQNIHYLNVFQRTQNPCPCCKTPIKKITQSGRSSFFCSNCQI